jgi:hypothetical protein
MWDTALHIILWRGGVAHGHPYVQMVLKPCTELLLASPWPFSMQNCSISQVLGCLSQPKDVNCTDHQ